MSLNQDSMTIESVCYGFGQLAQLLWSQFSPIGNEVVLQAGQDALSLFILEHFCSPLIPNMGFNHLNPLLLNLWSGYRLKHWLCVEEHALFIPPQLVELPLVSVQFTLLGSHIPCTTQQDPSFLPGSMNMTTSEKAVSSALLETFSRHD